MTEQTPPNLHNQPSITFSIKEIIVGIMGLCIGAIISPMLSTHINKAAELEATRLAHASVTKLTEKLENEAAELAGKFKDEAEALTKTLEKEKKESNKVVLDIEAKLHATLETARQKDKEIEDLRQKVESNNAIIQAMEGHENLEDIIKELNKIAKETAEKTALENTQVYKWNIISESEVENLTL